VVRCPGLRYPVAHLPVWNDPLRCHSVFACACGEAVLYTGARKVADEMLPGAARRLEPLGFEPWLSCFALLFDGCYLLRALMLFPVHSLPLPEGRAGTAWKATEQQTFLVPP
jgi:hypothetical protein